MEYYLVTVLCEPFANAGRTLFVCRTGRDELVVCVSENENARKDIAFLDTGQTILVRGRVDESLQINGCTVLYVVETQKTKMIEDAVGVLN